MGWSCTWTDFKPPCVDSRRSRSCVLDYNGRQVTCAVFVSIGHMKTSFFISTVLLLLTSVRSFAQEQSRTPYELHLKTDLPAFGIAGAAAVIPLFYSSDVRKTCPCLPSAVN